MRRFDARCQNENETLVKYEQALRILHREGWPTATIEQRDAALKRRFEEGLLSNEMTQFLRPHARDSDFTETLTKARQFAEKTVTIVEDQSQKANQVNAIETGKSDWKPLSEGFERIMQNAIKPLPKALNPQQNNVSRFREVHPRFAAENNQSSRWRQPPQGERFDKRCSVSPSSHFLNQNRQREGFGPAHLILLTEDVRVADLNVINHGRRKPPQIDEVFRVIVGCSISRVVIRKITQNKTEHFHRGQFRTEPGAQQRNSESILSAGEKPNQNHA